VSATASATVIALAGRNVAQTVAAAAPMTVPTIRLTPFAQVSPRRGWMTTTAEVIG
jgi:hypothetical protein